VRVSWVYGPPLVTDDPPRGPIPAFLKAVLKRQAIRLPSGADFAASFTYVSDVAAGLLAAWRACELHHDVYHLGSGINYTARQVADAVRAAVHRYKRGRAKSGRGGKGGKVKSRKQAIAIALSKARKKGKKVPRKKR
jgi:nucleoside-diphosphate-sugar epimerase